VQTINKKLWQWQREKALAALRDGLMGNFFDGDFKLKSNPNEKLAKRKPD